MIPIYICEDNLEHLNTIKKIIENYIFIQEYDMQIVCSSTTPEEILSLLAPDMSLGIYFFDIDLNSEIDGLKLAQQIRRFDPAGYIIFITSHTDRWRMTFEYKIAAFDFIGKTPDEALSFRISSCLKTAWERYRLLAPTIKKTVPFTLNGKRVYHDLNDILFFESSKDSHRIIIHTENSSLNYSGTLSELEETLPPNFIRCHRSFIANLDKVHYFDEKQKLLYFSSQLFCPVSVRQKYILKKAFSLSHLNK